MAEDGQDGGGQSKHSQQSQQKHHAWKVGHVGVFGSIVRNVVNSLILAKHCGFTKVKYTATKHHCIFFFFFFFLFCFLFFVVENYCFTNPRRN
jgi:hypothetical protein